EAALLSLLNSATALISPNPACLARTEVSANEHPFARWSSKILNNSSAPATPRARVKAPKTRACSSQPLGKKCRITIQSSASSPTDGSFRDELMPCNHIASSAIKAILKLMLMGRSPCLVRSPALQAHAVIMQTRKIEIEALLDQFPTVPKHETADSSCIAQIA